MGNGRNSGARALAELNARIVSCELCPRLRRHSIEMAQTKRRAYLDHEYWGRPVPSFGDPLARVLILGLAPGAHGSNRTGRPFTGDGSGNFMYPVLYEAGFASQPTSISRDDGMKLHDAWISAVVRSAGSASSGGVPGKDRFRWIHCASDSSGKARATRGFSLCARRGVRGRERALSARYVSSFAAEYEHRETHGRDVPQDIPARSRTRIGSRCRVT